MCEREDKKTKAVWVMRVAYFQITKPGDCEKRWPESVKATSKRKSGLLVSWPRGWSPAELPPLLQWRKS